MASDCSTGDVLYYGGGAGVTKLFDQGIDGLLSALASAILNAAVNLFANVAGSIKTFGDDTTQSKIGAQLNWLVVVIAVASLMFAAARMALERRGQAGVSALKGLLRMVLVAGAASWVLTRLATAGDNYTDYLYKVGVESELKTIASCGTDAGTAFLLILVGLLLLIAGIIHIILLYIRLGVMVVLSATLPLSAAASMTEWGSAWWRKHVGWLVAWLLFKPATGLVIYAGVVMINSTSSNATQQKIAGCGVLLLSAVALPALLRLVVPATAALGSSDGASGLAMAGGAAAGKMATGAVASGARGLSGIGGGGSPQRPTGAAATGGGGSGGAAGGGGGIGSGGGKGSSVGGLATVGSGIANVGRAAAGAVGAAAGAASNASGAAAHHANNVVQSSLPGIHDGDSH